MAIAGDTRVLRDLRSSDVATRLDAVRHITRTGQRQYIPKLTHLLAGDESNSVRACSAWALGRFRPREAIAILRRALSDRDPSVRKDSALALGEMADYASLETIWRLARSESDPEIRNALFGAAKKIRLEPTRVHRKEMVRRLRPPEPPTHRIAAIIRELERLTPGQDHNRIVELRKRMRSQDHLYFRDYMEWVKRRPSMQEALDNPRLVYGSLTDPQHIGAGPSRHDHRGRPLL